MKLSIFAAAALAAAAVAAPAFASDPTGLWQTPTNGGQVQISRCGQALCGVLVTSNHIRATPGTLDEKTSNRALRGRTLRNLPLLTGFSDAGDIWKGTIYDPESGKSYKSKINRNPNGTLKVQGCIAFLCKTQTWTPTR